MNESISTARRKLVDGSISSGALVEDALSRALDPSGEGSRVFVHLDADRVRRSAEAIDKDQAMIASLPIGGIPVSVKDLFDVQGEVTAAGSPQLSSRPTARDDAPAIVRLRRAGAVLVGRTNMSEFAFSGVGLNPHFGTPANPYDRARRRIPGGSTSGGAVSVADGMALAALGSDTGGSIRIPAALCGLTGFKPTQSRIPLTGVFPLAPSLDSVGTIAHTVSCCAILDAILAAEPPDGLPKADLRSISFATPKNYFVDGMDSHVARTFEATVSKLAAAGATIVDVSLPEVQRMIEVNSRGGLAPAESYRFHQKLGTNIDAYDRIVRDRVLRGRTINDSDYALMLEARRTIIQSFDEAHGRWDAILCPTVPIVAPEIETLANDAEELARVNALLLRNPSAANFLDRCALTIPCHEAGAAPVGLMLIGRRLQDRFLLSIGRALEHVLNGSDRP